MLVRCIIVTFNCISIQLLSASNQALEIAFVNNPKDETNKISNLNKGLNHLAENGSSNQLIIG